MGLLPILIPFTYGHIFWASWCPPQINNNFNFGVPTPDYNPILTYAPCPVAEIWKPANGSCLGCYCINGFVSRCFLSRNCPGDPFPPIPSTSTTTSSPNTLGTTPTTITTTTPSLAPVTPTASPTTTQATENVTLIIKPESPTILHQLLRNHTLMTAIKKATFEILQPSISAKGGNSKSKTTSNAAGSPSKGVAPSTTTRRSCEKKSSMPANLHERQEVRVEDDSEELKNPKRAFTKSTTSTTQRYFPIKHAPTFRQVENTAPTAVGPAETAESAEATEAVEAVEITEDPQVEVAEVTENEEASGPDEVTENVETAEVGEIVPENVEGIEVAVVTENEEIAEAGNAETNEAGPEQSVGSELEEVGEVPAEAESPSRNLPDRRFNDADMLDILTGKLF